MPPFVVRMEIKAKMTSLRKKLADMGSRQQERDDIIHAIRRFMEMERLTLPLLRELIDHIDVYETQGVGKKPDTENCDLLSVSGLH